MIIPKEEIIKLGIIKEFIGEIQFQPAGVDLTLNKVFEFKTKPIIDFDNKERKISEVKEIEFEEFVELKEGAYKVLFNEVVNIPKDVVGIAMPRSSLLRSGITLETAVWDPGYYGRSEALLIIHNQNGAIFKKNARIAQLFFIRLEKETEEYSGVYKGENII